MSATIQVPILKVKLWIEPAPWIPNMWVLFHTGLLQSGLFTEAPNFLFLSPLWVTVWFRPHAHAEPGLIGSPSCRRANSQSFTSKETTMRLHWSWNSNLPKFSQATHFGLRSWLLCWSPFAWIQVIARPQHLIGHSDEVHCYKSADFSGVRKGSVPLNTIYALLAAGRGECALNTTVSNKSVAPLMWVLLGANSIGSQPSPCIPFPRSCDSSIARLFASASFRASYEKHFQGLAVWPLPQEALAWGLSNSKR